MIVKPARPSSDSRRVKPRDSAQTPSRQFRRQPVQERSQQTVRRILEAAETLTAQRAVAEITSHRIAEAAGVTIGALYRFFPDRDAVLDEVMLQRIRDFEGLLDEYLRGSRLCTPQEIGPEVIDLSVAYMESYPAFRALWFAGYRSPRTIEENRRSLAAIVDRLADHLVSLGFADTPALKLKVTVGVEASNALIDLAFKGSIDTRDAILTQAREMMGGYFSHFGSEAS